MSPAFWRATHLRVGRSNECTDGSPQRSKHMKLAKFTYLITLGASLSLTVVGCRKGLDKTTDIPGRKYGSISDQPAQPIGAGTPVGTSPDGVGQPQPVGSTID